MQEIVMNEALALRVREIVAEQVQRDVDEVTLESTAEDLGLDSMKIVEIIFQLEEAFDVSISFNANNPDELEFQMTKIGDMVRSLEKMIAESE